jgi:hypothetical protein
MKYLLFFLFCVNALPADKPHVTASEQPHSVDVELRAKFWRAMAEQQSAKAIFDKAVDNLREAQEAMRKACGDSKLIVDQTGEPACEARETSSSK